MLIRVEGTSANSLYRVLSVQVGSKSIVTPTIAVKDTVLKDEDLWSLKNQVGSSFVLENYIALNKPDLSDRQIERNNKLMNLSNQLEVPLLTVFEIPRSLFGRFVSSPLTLKSFIKKIQRNIMADIIASPYVKWLSGKYWELRGEYLNFYKFFIEESSDFGGVRSVVLQNIMTSDLEEIMEVCVDHDIKFIVLDFGASTIYSYKDFVSKVLSYFNRVVGRDTMVFYGLNINRGRAGRGSKEFSARDIVAFGYGIDILGTKRIGAVPKDRPSSLSIYYLDIDDYCYKLWREAESVEEKRCLEEKENAILKIRESNRIRKMVREKRNMISYLSEKSCIDKRDLESIANWSSIISYTPEIDLSKFFEE